MLGREELVAALLKKGFVPTEGAGHRHFFLWVGGKKTGIRTEVSRGTEYKELGDALIHFIRLQLKLDNKNQLLALVECPMGHAEYVEHLVNKGLRILPQQVSGGALAPKHKRKPK